MVVLVDQRSPQPIDMSTEAGIRAQADRIFGPGIGAHSRPKEMWIANRMSEQLDRQRGGSLSLRVSRDGWTVSGGGVGALSALIETQQIVHSVPIRFRLYEFLAILLIRGNVYLNAVHHHTIRLISV